MHFLRFFACMVACAFHDSKTCEACKGQYVNQKKKCAEHRNVCACGKKFKDFKSLRQHIDKGRVLRRHLGPLNFPSSTNKTKVTQPFKRSRPRKKGKGKPSKRERQKVRKLIPDNWTTTPTEFFKETGKEKFNPTAKRGSKLEKEVCESRIKLFRYFHDDKVLSHFFQYSNSRPDETIRFQDKLEVERFFIITGLLGLLRFV